MGDEIIHVVGETRLRVVEGTVCKVGTLHYTGAPYYNSPAELVILNREAIAMLFPVAPNIRKLLERGEEDCDPIEVARCEKHLCELITDNYIRAYQDVLDERFDADIRDTWLVSSGYMPSGSAFRRSYIIHPEEGILDGGEIADHLRGMAIGPLSEGWEIEVTARHG